MKQILNIGLQMHSQGTMREKCIFEKCVIKKEGFLYNFVKENGSFKFTNA